MATNHMIPVSNPAGNNQTSPGTIVPMANPQTPITHAVGATGTPLGVQTTLAANPLVPGVPAVPGATNPNSALQNKQLVDIYGKGIGGDIGNLLDNISGVDAKSLQDYIASLAPQEAQAQANLNSSLGAAGVGANSSVTALADANLHAQEQASIAGESAQLLQHGQDLQASILGGMKGDASKEVSASGWDVFGQVMGQIGADAGGIMKGAADLGIGL